jgi:hypothetical protein
VFDVEISMPLMLGPVPRTVAPVPVEVVTPVPPLATANVPASVIAPDVADDGVSPVVPPLNVVTEEVHVGVAPAPAEVRTCPDVPTEPANEIGDVEPASANVPVVVTLLVFRVPVTVGDADSTTEPVPVEDVTPVPPLETAKVPVIVIVPDVVTGPPLNVNPVEPPLTSTEVTVPVPVRVVHVGVAPAPPEVRT